MSTRPRRAPLAELALVGICAVWGLTFPMVQDAVAVVPVMTFLAYRFLAAALIVAIAFRVRLSRLSRDAVLAGAAMGVFLTGGYVFQTFGLERTSAANAGFITGLFVVLTPLFGALLLRQAAGGVAWAAALVSMAGLLLLSGFGGGGRLAGDALVLLCACSFSFHILVTDRAVKAHDVVGLLVVQLAFCGGVSLLVAAAQAELTLPRAPEVWAALVVTAVFASALGFFVQTYAQRHASPARTALILTSEPVFAGLFAYLLKGQTLTATGWLGAALIMIAIVAVEAVPYLRRPVPLPER